MTTPNTETPPRTLAATKVYPCHGSGYFVYVDPQHMAEVELELIAAQKKVKELQENNDWLSQEITRIKELIPTASQVMVYQDLLTKYKTSQKHLAECQDALSKISNMNGDATMREVANATLTAANREQTMKYRKKPVVVEAMQFTEDSKNQCFNFVTCNKYADFAPGGIPELRIHTPEGEMVASLGDYIIKGVKGEFYPCKPAIFNATYEPVNNYLEGK